MITSYNITFTTPHSFKFAEKRSKSINNLQLTINNLNLTSSLLAIILPNFQGLKFDTLPYYRLQFLFFTRPIEAKIPFFSPSPDFLGKRED